jgi:hypothetical protein
VREVPRRHSGILRTGQTLVLDADDISERRASLTRRNRRVQGRGSARGHPAVRIQDLFLGHVEMGSQLAHRGCATERLPQLVCSRGDARSQLLQIAGQTDRAHVVAQVAADLTENRGHGK